MTKDEALSLAITVGAHIERNSCNSEMLTSFTEHELLAFANAIADAQREKDAKICDEMADSETFGATTTYPGELTDAGINYSQCAEAIRANKE